MVEQKDKDGIVKRYVYDGFNRVKEEYIISNKNKLGELKWFQI